MVQWFVAAGLGLSLLGSSVFAAPDLSDYSLDFVDEFNGSSLDSSLWNSSPIWGPYVVTNMEEQYYVDILNANQGFGWNPFEVSGGILTIKAEAVTDPAVPAAPAQPPENDQFWIDNPEFQFNPDYSSGSRNYLSGIITSSDSFNFTHGYAEIRAQLPAGQGLWPAFWQLTTKYVEDVPEIDVIELLGQKPNEANHTYHYFNIDNNWELVSTPTFKTVGPDFTQDYHTYGVMWEPRKMVWYLDGVPVKTLDESDGYTLPKQSMYLIANLAVGGNWPGSPDNTTPLPAEYKIDYIKVFRKDMPTPVTPAVLNSDYQLMFEENFNGNAIDSGKWNSAYLWGPYFRINAEEQIYIDTLGRHADEAVNPFTVSNGTLKIIADEILPADLPAQEAATDPVWANEYPSHQYNPDYNMAGGWIPAYSSGALTSYDSFKFVHGYAEMRAKVPSGSGMWPAFWLLNGYYVGPQPELDIMELQGELADTIHHSYHYYNESGELVSSNETFTATGTDFSADFHTYAVEWDPDYIKWYVDGQVTRVLNSGVISSQLMYLIVNLAVGGTFVGPVQTTFPKQYEIDYIRVYQLKNSNPISPPPASTVALPNLEWRMISIPYDTPQGQNTAANMFADDIPGIYTQDWILFGYNSITKAYFDPGLNGSLVRGASYWISQATGNTVTLDIPQPGSVAESQSQAGCATVECFAYTPAATAGNGNEWHLVGNPFSGDANAADVRVVTDAGTACESGCALPEAAELDLVHFQFFAFDGTAYVIKEGNDDLEGWSGFWLATLPLAAAENATLLFAK